MNSLNLLISQLSKDPVFQQARRMGQGKSKEEIAQIARNLCAERGLNYDEVWSTFQTNMKGFM